jgi:hypothetical protein
MKKILIPEGLRGKELFAFLIENKDALKAQKKSFIKETDVVICGPELLVIDKDGTLKAAGEGEADPTKVHVKVVGNACWWMDSQRDVLIKDSAKRSIAARKGMIPHLADHNQKLAGQVGDVTDVYLEDVSLRKLGLDKSGATQCVVMESDVQKSYDERVFNLYKRNRVNQHSIGLQYVTLDLAINDEEHEKEIDFWNKYIDKVINKEEAEELGYFWVVSEYKLLEVSGVLFGANELTPTLESGKSHVVQPVLETPVATPESEFDLSAAIKTTKFFNF